jgi:hypothetical protein
MALHSIRRTIEGYPQAINWNIETRLIEGGFVDIKDLVASEL